MILRFTKSKYKNRKVDSPDGKFDSVKEYKRWGELKLLEKAGEITNLERQVKFDFYHEGHKLGSYIADYQYKENGNTVTEDCKGFRTATYRQKKKWMKIFFGITIKET